MLPPAALPAQPATRPAAATATTPATAIAHATVIDVEHGRRLPDRTVVVTGGRITAVGPSGRVRIPAGTRVVDGRGKFVIPGLWDMHAHVDDAAAWAFPLYVANGVTGVRDMGSHLDRIAEWRAGWRRGDVMPRVVAAGPILTGVVDDVDPRVVNVADSVGGERAVDSLVGHGVDLIKVHDWLTADAYAGIAAAARRRGIPFAGHVPVAVDPLTAVAAGQRSIEHQLSAWCDYVMYASAAESTYVGRARSLVGRPFDPARLIGNWPAAELDSLTASFRPAKADSLARAMARAGVWHTPTLHVFSTIYLLPPDSVAASRGPRLRYLPAEVRGTLPAILAEGAALSRDRARLAARSRLRDLHADMVRRLYRAGVPLLAGTDAVPAYPLTVPGFTLHDELAALVGAGLTPAAALRAATFEPARYLAATDSLGTVAPGRLADLVVLDADPLASIRNTTRIFMVVASGRVIDAAERARLLAAVERRAGAAGRRDRR
jgi:imidazolonepropionase-like amidohydrolase